LIDDCRLWIADWGFIADWLNPQGVEWSNSDGSSESAIDPQSTIRSHQSIDSPQPTIDDSSDP
jgi:hypothetical protein